MYIPCTDYTSEQVLASDADNSSFPAVFTNIQWGDYQLMIGCGNNSVCSALSQWIQFPEPVSVPAHPSHSELGATIFGLKEQLADYAANYTTLKDEYVTLKANYDTHTPEDIVSALREELTNKIEALHSDSDSECARDWATLLFLIIADTEVPTSIVSPISSTTVSTAAPTTPSGTATDVTTPDVESTEATNSKCECV